MEVPANTLVVLELDPADYALRLQAPDAAAHAGSGLSGAVVHRADEREVLRFATQAGDVAPWGDVTWTTTDEDLAPSDAVFLLSVLLLVEHHQDAFLHAERTWGFVDARTQRRVELPHPPRIETSQALVGSVPLATRLQLLIEACELALPVWSAWAKGGTLTYFDGVMAMAAVPHDLAEATIASVRAWLSDGDPAPLQACLGEYRSLHWPMLEDNWKVPENVYYSLFAPCNLAECALEGGNLAAALVCIQQAAAARCTNAQDTFLGEPFRKAFFLAWWRACARVLLAARARGSGWPP